MGYVREMPTRYRDWSAVFVSWWLLLGGILLGTYAVGSLLQAEWWQAAVSGSAAVAIGAVVAGRAVRLTRGEDMAVRVELLGVIRSLPPSHAWAVMGRHAAYQLQVNPSSGIPGLGAGVYLEEIDLDDPVRTPSGGRSVTARRYGLLPWTPKVRLEVVDGPLPGSAEYDQRRSGQHTLSETLAGLWAWRARRAGLLFLSPAEVRELAARLRQATPAD